MESFTLLQQHGIIDIALLPRLRGMVHFRNLAVHQYQRIDLAIVQAVIETGLDDLIHYGDQVMTWIEDNE